MQLRRSVYILFLAALVFATVYFSAIRSAEQVRTEPNKKTASASRPNLILISIDTLRADRLGSYDYGRDTSPFIDSLAQSGTLFENAISVSSWTLPSHVSLFTGLYPTSHGVSRDNGVQIGEETATLAELLRAAGYRTFGYTGGNYVGRHYGFAKGFEEYHNSDKRFTDGEKGLAGSLIRARKQIENFSPSESFFIFLHTFDVHCPYDPPEPYFSMFKSEDAEEIEANKCGKNFYNTMDISPGQVRYVSDKYDGSIRWADDNLKRFFDFLKGKGLFENTIVVVTSDHGEEFHEHGRIGHQKSLHKELLLVPLIFSGPGVPQGRRAPVVSLVDVTPTLLELLKLPVPSEMQGHSLVSLMKDPSAASIYPSRQFAELDRKATLRSTMSTEEHYILDQRKNRDYYYDLKSDPTEQRNAAGDFPERVAKLKSELEKLIDSLKRMAVGATDEKTAEQIEELKSLGYM